MHLIRVTSPLVFLLLFFVFSTSLKAQDQSVTSPDGRLKITVNLINSLSWSAYFDGQAVIEDSQIGMRFDQGRQLGNKPILKSVQNRSAEEIIEPVIPNRDSRIQSFYNEMILKFKGSFEVHFRAYDDGVAYRIVDRSKKSRQVVSEKLTLDFPEGSMSYFPKEESMYSHNERLYLKQGETEFKTGDFCSLPVLFDTGKAKVLFTEASLHHYPGMFLEYEKDMSFKSKFPKFVLKAVANENDSPDRNQILAKEAEYIAQIAGARAYPWRAFIISDDDRAFVESNLVTQLSGSSKIDDPSWIKPGMVAWDWYNANNIYGVDFKAGINTETYTYFIDFAAENGIEYVILDEGWTKSTTEIMESNPEIDIAELVAYARSKDVELILWVLWKPLEVKTEEILKLYSDWGTAGVKVDFMQRSDQSMVSSYENIAEIAAKYKMLVDYHGAFKPAGIERVWPNLINYEGVKGNENNKWSADISPEHNVTIPFIRMAAGPMDFTPGAMVNKHSRNFSASFFRPMSLGTRAHQLAMYVIYEAPLQMLCESPSRYRQEQETVDFITAIPTTWDETYVLEAAVSDYIVVARRNGENWYMGAMTDDTGRDFELSLDFLDHGEYELELFKDGANAAAYAEDYKREVLKVNKDTKLQISLVSGGGWTGIFRKASIRNSVD